VSFDVRGGCIINNIAYSVNRVIRCTGRLYHQYHCVLSKPCHSMYVEVVSSIPLRTQ